MEHILITDLPDTVQQFIRSVRSLETLLVLDGDDGAVIANITAIPGRGPAVLAEVAIREPDGDWIRCVPACDNTPDMDGFASCLPDGTEVEPVGGPGGWDGKLLVCLKCGRIINQDTLAVTGRRYS